MYALVDIGSNTMRLNIYTYKEDGITQMLTNKVTAGLAAYVNDAGYLTEKGIHKAILALNEFKSILEIVEVKDTYVFATASLRNIKNSLEAKKLIERETGFTIELISGEEEGKLVYMGATLKLNLKEGIVIDIGGGSTELVYYKEEEIKNALSLPFGSLSLFKKYVGNFLPTKLEIKKIERKVHKELDKIPPMAIPVDTQIICGVGGTVRATCELKNEIFELPSGDKTIIVKDMKNILNYFLKNRYDFTSHLINTIPDRLHTILPGMIILDTVANYYGSEKILVSEFGVREGYLLQMIKDKGIAYD